MEYLQDDWNVTRQLMQGSRLVYKVYSKKNARIDKNDDGMEYKDKLICPLKGPTRHDRIYPYAGIA